MTVPRETSGAAPARGSGPSPALALDEPSPAALERERVRDPDALQAERRAPEPRERLAGQHRPSTPKRAAQNLKRLATALHEADPRTRKKG